MLVYCNCVRGDGQGTKRPNASYPIIYFTNTRKKVLKIKNLIIDSALKVINESTFNFQFSIS